MRFHPKYHNLNHHTLSTEGYPDSASDPIASSTSPFNGDFYLNGALSSNSTVEASAIESNLATFNTLSSINVITTNLTCTGELRISTPIFDSTFDFSVDNLNVNGDIVASTPDTTASFNQINVVGGVYCSNIIATNGQYTSLMTTNLVTNTFYASEYYDTNNNQILSRQLSCPQFETYIADSYIFETYPTINETLSRPVIGYTITRPTINHPMMINNSVATITSYVENSLSSMVTVLELTSYIENALSGMATQSSIITYVDSAMNALTATIDTDLIQPLNIQLSSIEDKINALIIALGYHGLIRVNEVYEESFRLSTYEMSEYINFVI
jgi:hypothetical protein